MIKDCKADDRDEPGRESRRFDYLQNSRTSTFGWFILSISISFFCFLKSLTLDANILVTKNATLSNLLYNSTFVACFREKKTLLH